MEVAMLKYENGGFVKINMDDVLPDSGDLTWGDAVKEAGFQHWGHHGSTDRFNVKIYRRENGHAKGDDRLTDDDWLIDMDGGEVGVYVPIYCPTTVDFMTCFVAMGPMICAAELAFVTGSMEEAAVSIGAIKVKGKSWSVADMLLEIILPHISRG